MLKDSDDRDCPILNLEKYLPTITPEYLAEADKELRPNRQVRGLVNTIITDPDAYHEFLTIVLASICGINILNKMCDHGESYASAITRSDEAFGLLLLEDKSLLWREVAKKRIEKAKDGSKCLGMKDEMKIKDKYGQNLTVYSNGGIVNPVLKKGWTREGLARYNELMLVLKAHRTSDEGKQAMKEQEKRWKEHTRFGKSKQSKKSRKRKALNSMRAEGEGTDALHMEWDNPDW